MKNPDLTHIYSTLIFACEQGEKQLHNCDFKIKIQIATVLTACIPSLT
jgi:hypothetical protein